MSNQFGMGGMQMPMMYGMGMGGMPMQGMQMPMGMGMMGGMGGMQMNNQMNDDDDWMQGFKMGVEEVNNTTIGTSRNIVLSYGTTIDQALKKYLDQVGKLDLVNSDKISFLFNAAKLNFGDNTTVEKFFKNSVNPKVVVNDTNNLIGA